ncbi:nucleotidyltransferase family protein [Phenylobacterium koreense]|uniref:Molybdenum cofactor cytidylyltransferase n=1 Tax=Phenylobacterium koreense TaxID=266125 RepID=A0ABV2EIP3_9CAUL
MATGAGDFEAIVLAAGAGSRFGGGKLLTPWAGGVLLDGALAAAFAAPVRRVILVTGADDRVGAAAGAFAEGAGEAGRLVIVHAPDHAEGMGASLRRAAAELGPDCAGVFVFLGDMPRIPHAVLAALAQAVREGAPAAAPVFAGQRGHPALIGAGLLPHLRELSGDAGARGLLKGLGDRLALVEAPDDGVLFDVDQPGDLDRR